MSLLAALVVASWFLIFWSGARSPKHEPTPGYAALMFFSSLALAIATLL